MSDQINSDLYLSNEAANQQSAGFAFAAFFTLSMLLSSLLLFFIQPMFAKMALPLLGGSSGVWNTAMVFFQSVLLAGYLYAHLLSKFFTLRIQISIHAAVMTIALTFLPIAIPQGWEVPQTGVPTFWLLGLFGAALGAPFFALSANAPLLQKWFSYSDHKAAHDPYFLYAASNIGSLVSLLSYPILIEPFFKLSEQTGSWAIGFGILMAMLIGSGIFAMLRVSNKSHVQIHEEVQAEPLTWSRRLSWVGFALVPSSLMLGVTSHLTMNVASAPFIWVVPLALYLLTFVFAFSPKEIISRRLTAKAFPFVALASLVIISVPFSSFIFEVIANLVCFFLITQMCHDRLANARPPAENLTEFYFFVSLGGVIGGAMTALVAPIVFDGTYEYHLTIVASGLVAVGLMPKREELPRELIRVLAAITAAIVFVALVKLMPPMVKTAIFAVLSGILISGVVFMRDKPLRLFGNLAAIAILAVSIKVIVGEQNDKVIFADRSFFGISKVIYKETENGPMHLFQHGNTKHNLQLRSQEALNYPLAYYSPEGAFGATVDAVREEKGTIDVAIVGLGAGAMACHQQDGENWKYYEIDPSVVSMARNPDLFTYVSNCAPDAPIIVGDARLTLQKERANTFDLIMIDAFSSNVIPAHLVTVEALELYRSKLKDGGYVFFHTSNRNLDVSSVVLNAAKASGLATRLITTEPDETTRYKDQVSTTTAVLVADSENDLDTLLETHPQWKSIEGSSLVGIWRDDFSHVLGALIARSFSD